MMKVERPSPKSWKKLLRKYRLVLLDETSFEERFSIVLSRLNVFVVVGTTAVFLVLLTIVLIAYSPLREYIPGYASSSLRRSAIQLEHQSDSLIAHMSYQEAYIRRLQVIMLGDLPVDSLWKVQPPADWSADKLEPSERERSLRHLVDEIESSSSEIIDPEKGLILPLSGDVVKKQRSSRREFGIQISGQDGDNVVAMKDGTVLSVEGTPSLGFVVLVQHSGGALGRYGNLAKVSKRAGDYLRQGDVLGALGEAPEGEQPYLSVQYWLGGESLNLEKLLGF
jgi:hypothetical protein